MSKNAIEVNYLVAEIIAQKRKSHTIGENLILPYIKVIVDKMLLKNALQEIKKGPL